MLKPVRVVASFVLLVSIVLVFIGAFVLDSDVRDLFPLKRSFLTNFSALVLEYAPH